MLYLAAFIFVFTAVQLLVAATNLIFKPRLNKSPLQGNPLISVLIPARNEAENIDVLLTDLINQHYQNIEIVVFDDQSDDQTVEIVSALAETDSRIKLFRSNGLPNGWLGKNFGCHSLSLHAKGEYLLFLDADVRMGEDIILSVVSYSETYRLGLLSIFPEQIVITPGEKMTVPIMNYILLSLLPLPLVQWTSFRSLAAANGQFMLFNTSVYNRFMPHEHVKNCKVEDIEIARYLKAERIPIACLTGNKSIRCRMYNSFGDAVRGFSKNIISFFGNSFVLAVIFWFITTLGFIPVLISFSVNFLVVYIVMLLLIRLFVALTSHQRILDSFLYFIPQQLVMGVVMFSSFLNKYFFHYQWKGRSIG
ncbi:MAG TPA: glycosyltransferase family 2 protein [Prolixibacteraceae bacterium]|nr:glycosyltransferase family 2 protein [Prolixibacteraceae bacterium]